MGKKWVDFSTFYSSIYSPYIWRLMYRIDDAGARIRLERILWGYPETVEDILKTLEPTFRRPTASFPKLASEIQSTPPIAHSHPHPSDTTYGVPFIPRVHSPKVLMDPFHNKRLKYTTLHQRSESLDEENRIIEEPEKKRVSENVLSLLKGHPQW